jgi:hypothetical protein
MFVEKRIGDRRFRGVRVWEGMVDRKRVSRELSTNYLTPQRNIIGLLSINVFIEKTK